MRAKFRSAPALAGGLLLALALGGANAAEAQFLEYPFYGTPLVNSYFDHQSPNYTKNGNLLRYDGQYGTWSYDGHSGIDYAEAYTPILNAGHGTLTHVGWWSSNHEAYYGLSMLVDHGNGYRSLYGHLSAALYSNGQWVGRGWYIGSGGTTGNSTGPHLHYEVQRNVGSWQPVDPQGWSGGFTDPWSSVAVSSYLWLGSPVTNWPVDYSTHIVDNSNSGFTKGCNSGSCPYWYSSGYGYGTGMWHTYSNGASADYWARWTPNLPYSANYEVFVHVPNYNATTHAARYTVNSNAGSKTVYVDQHAAYGYPDGAWIRLGTYYCPAGGTCWVQVSDATYIDGNYTEPSSTYRRIGVDAVKWVRH